VALVDAASPDAPAPDAPASSNDAGDATTDAGRPCDPDGPFGSTVLLSGAGLNLPGVDEGTPRLSPNELTLYFWSNRTPDGGTGEDHLYVATRTSKLVAFDTPVEITELTSPKSEASPTVTADGLTIFFESDRLGGANAQLFVATRSQGDPMFGTANLLANVNDPQANEATPYVHPLGQSLYFSSSRGDAGQDIYRSLFQSGGSFAPAAAVDEVNTATDEYSPCISADDLTLVWGSSRSAADSVGGYDIFLAKRSAPGGKFEPAQNAGPGVNSTALDLPGWISPDGCTLYFESDRAGERDLYVATRPP
jgi:Tol biopolymer transport system component